MTNDETTKTYAVIGLARAGIPAARFLVERGNRVLGYDNKPLEELSDEALSLRDVGVELRVGEHDFAGLDECDTIVLSPGLKIHHEPLKSVLEKCEARGVEVIGELELAARNCPAPIIAVTGTKGKSTTVKLIAEILQECGQDAVRAGNTGIPLIAELPNLSAESWAVVEVSSFQLERAPTFRPRIGVLLNLLEDHQDYHPTLEQYWETKLKLFANQDKGDTAIFNIDDERTRVIWEQRINWSNWCSSALNRCEGEWLCKSSVKEGYIGWMPDRQFFPLMSVEEVPLRGAHNQSNVAAALAVILRVLGEDKTIRHHGVIGDAIRNFQSLPHRLEIVARKGGITWVNDSQATIPDAAIRALEAFPAPVTLIAGGRAKIEEESFSDLGAAVARRAHCFLTIGEAGEMLAGVAKRAGAEPSKIIVAETLTNAVEQAKTLTPSGGTVVLSPACASFDQFTSFEARGEAFRAAVAALPD